MAKIASFAILIVGCCRLNLKSIASGIYVRNSSREQRDEGEALGKLAQLRGRSLPEIMKDLGIQPSDCV
jgi:hypothetical protein